MKFPDDRRLLFPVKPTEVRSAGVNECRLDTAVILSHGLWTGADMLCVHMFTCISCADPCQVEFSIVKRFASDVAEASCLPFSSLRKATLHKPTGSKGAKGSGGARGGLPGVSAGSGVCGGPAFPAISNLVHSERQDSLEGVGQECVLAISSVVRVNVQPQEKLNNTFNAF